jgi:multisubunit Na+/H+ antiporter MnhE subunit
MFKFIVGFFMGFFIASVMNNPQETKEHMSSVVDFISTKTESIKNSNSAL